MATVTIESCISDDNRKVLHNHNLDQSTFRGLKKNLSLTKRRKTRESDENSNCKRKRLAEDEFELDQRIHKNIFDLESEEADRLCSYFRCVFFLIFNRCSILQFYRTQKLLKVFF